MKNRRYFYCFTPHFRRIFTLYSWTIFPNHSMIYCTKQRERAESLFQDKGTFYPSSNLRSPPSPPKNFSSSFSRKCAETLLTYNYLATLTMVVMMVMKKNKMCVCHNLSSLILSSVGPPPSPVSNEKLSVCHDLYSLFLISSVCLSQFILTFSNIICVSSMLFFGLQGHHQLSGESDENKSF